MGELFPFIEAFDNFLPRATDLSRAFGIKDSIHMFTDSKQVLDIITSGKKTSKRRLAIDFKVIRDAFYRFEIDLIGLVRGEHNPVDGLSNTKHNDMLKCILSDMIDETPTVEWTVRKTRSWETKID